MKEFDFKRYGVRNATWKNILIFVFTAGRKGRLFDIVDMKYFPPSHINCRCSVVVR